SAVSRSIGITPGFSSPSASPPCEAWARDVRLPGYGPVASFSRQGSEQRRYQGAVAVTGSARGRLACRVEGGAMPQVDQLELSARVGEITNHWPTVGLAVGVVRNGSLDFYGRGFADIASNTPVGEDTVFSDRLGHQDLHRDCRDAAVVAGAGRSRHPRGRLPARLPADPGQGWLPAGDGAASADPYRRDP